MKVLGRTLRASVAGLLCAAALLVQAAPPPIEHFTNPSAIKDVAISPSGRRLAIIAPGASGYHQLAVVDLDPIGEARVVGSFADVDVVSARWVNDERLVFEAFPRAAVVHEGWAGTFAVNHDGTGPRLLIAWSRTPERAGSNIANKVLPYGWFLRSSIDDGSDDVLVYRRVNDSLDDLKSIELARLDTKTGALRSLSYDMPPGVRYWMLDAKLQPRAVMAYRDGRVKIHSRGSDEGARWVEVADLDPFTEASFLPFRVELDGTILVSASNGRDTTALYRFDPATRKLDAEPMLAVNGFDLPERIRSDSRTGHLVGVDLVADRRLTVWLDPELQRIQKSIDAALPAGRNNELHCGRCESTRFFVVRSSSDRQPGEYFLFDRTKASLERIGAARPWIVEATQGRRTFHRVTTRDGLTMPVIVTHPAGAASDDPLPAVVVVHGGPWLRGGNIGWNANAQFLASRGYRVIEPEFRGGEGFGFRHFKAGWKQWGLAMQDDLIDAVQWAAKQRLVDASRVCIYGGSYGGYAALMGPISHPDAYRCAASFAGVTDIDLMYSITWSDFSEAHKRYGMPVLIGDREKDAKQLARTSPLKRAGEIKVPILLAHGTADRRVPIEHAREFAAAVRSAGADIEVLYYNGEGHGWYEPKNHADFLEHLERFLAKSLQATH